MTYRNLLFLAFSLIGVTLQTSAQNRIKQTINSHWKFYKGNHTDASKPSFNDKNWEVVSLPHTWNDQDVLADGKRGYYRGDGWYRKELSNFEPEATKSYFIHCEGAGQKVNLYVNGNFAGSHIGGYSAFTFDITEHLKPDGNILAFYVDNTPNPNIPPISADFTFFGGIYRDVFLIETSEIHFNLLNHGSSGVFVSTPTVNEEIAEIRITGSIMNKSQKRRKVKIGVSINDKVGIVLREFEQETSLKANGHTDFIFTAEDLKDFKLWSPQEPNMYQVHIQLLENEQVIDELVEPLGFRWFRFDPKEGFFLNGKHLKLMGANRHQDYWGIGNALSDDIHRRDLQLLKNMGGNFIRLAHYPQDPAVLKAADEIGLLVWEETPLVNEITISDQHNANAEIMLKEMIRQHYNHPSVIMWGYMNEIYWAHRFLDPEIVDLHTTETVKLARELETLAREEDPYRYTAMALHNYPLYESSGLHEVPMVVGWNLYHGWYYDTFEDFGKFMDEQHQKYPDKIHFISEYGAGSDPRIHSTDPERFDFTIEGHKRFSESFLEQIMDRPYISGGAVWNLIDFSSERRIDTNPHLNNKGLATTDRTPKDPYYLFQAALSHQPILKIAETNWTERSGYPEKGEDIVRQPVQVYTNQSMIELFMNGKSLGAKKASNYHAVWSVPFSDGSNQFVARSIENESISDRLIINFNLIPYDFREKESPIDIAINAGCNYSFYDDKGAVTWIADKAYEEGSWGYLNGDPLYVSKKIGTKEDILTTTDLEPLYQSMRVGANGYQFDVPDGWYEVELLFVEPFPKSRRFVEGIESPEHPGGERIFNVVLNGITLYSSLDLLKSYGYNYPLRTRVSLEASNGKGIKVILNSIKGESVISGVRVRSK